MQIVEVEAIPFRIPMTTPVAFGLGTMDAAEHVLVRIRTDDGLTGYAEAPPRSMIYGESQASVVHAVSGWFGPMLMGRDPFDIGGAAAAMASVVGNHTAKAAIDIALHDIIGQAVGAPCHRLLGASADRLQVSCQIDFGSPESVVEQAIAARETYGVSVFKCKVGADLQRDLTTLSRMRDTFPEATIYADANQGYSYDDALRLLNQAQDLGLAWLEEPCRVSNERDRLRLADRSPIPIGGDESCRDLDEAARWIRNGAVSVISIKVARTGFTDSAAILALSRAFHVRTVVATQGDTAIGAVAGLHFGLAHRQTSINPAELMFWTSFEDDLLAAPLSINDGFLEAPTGTGLGITIDEAVLERVRQDRP